jgi:hypothetical protein
LILLLLLLEDEVGGNGCRCWRKRMTGRRMKRRRRSLWV